MNAHCYKCKGFIPDKVGDGSGIGDCKVIAHLKQKGEPIKVIEAAFKRLGNKPFWGGKDEYYGRNCYRFTEVINE